jgi:type I restriction enzyme R subunit
METTNFSFLKKYEPLFFQLATTAEKAFSADPNTTLLKLRQLGEALAQDVACRIGLDVGERPTQHELLYQINRKLGLDPVVRELFHSLRLAGNNAAHQFHTTHGEAISALKVARKLALWHCQAFSSKCVDVKPGPFIIPDDPSENLSKVQNEIQLLKSQLQATNQQLEGNQELLLLRQAEADEYEKLAQKMHDERNVYEQLALEAEAELIKVKNEFKAKLAQAQKEQDDDSIKNKIKKVAADVRKASSKLRLSEEETRIIIDSQLRERGWEVDTATLDYRKGARPEKGRNKAIAEWPCYNPQTKKNTRADYVLFIGLRPFATIEAKKFGNDVMDDLRQAEEYSRDLAKVSIIPDNVIQYTTAEASPEYNVANPVYKTPFAFSTNGREFQHQLKTKSGIWFRDLRRSTNKSRPLMAWPTPEELLESIDTKHTQPDLLDKEPMAYLGLRPFQEKAVKAVEQAIIQGQREILIAMATGTGKTRTTIGLMYRLLKARLFNRILFLVDRNTLGIQAQDAFKDMRLERNKSFAEIYDVKELQDQAPDSKTKVQVATVQAMVSRVFKADNPIPIRQYDCIVVDEAHRGYTLDKDMTEGEMELRNFNDYVSAYRRVLDYFDAVRIGLTATPAAHTVDIFGHPVFTYSYREAVVDGWLVDYEPPYTLQTRLNKEGIHFDSGEKVTLVNTLGETRTEELPDELDFDVDDFNQRVLNENFNKVVCDELAKNFLDPTSREKTLIFCINDQHADMVVKLMEEALDTYHGPQDADTVMKITGSIRDPQGAIRQ